jgi:uncharacterized protein with beta-barrel porin domain
VTTGAGRGGTFAGLTDPYVGNYAFHLEAYYTDYDAYLDVIQDSFMPFGDAGRQDPITRWLDGIAGEPSMDDLIDLLNSIPGDQLPAVFDLFAPEDYGLLVDATIGGASVFLDNIEQRLRQVRAGGVGGLSRNVILLDPARSFAQNAPPPPTTATDAAAAKPAPAPKPPKGWGFFVAGNAQVIGGDIESAGLTLGVDAQIRNGLVAGAALDYVSGSVDMNSGGDADVEGGKGSLYATWFDGATFVNAALGAGFNSYDTRRAAIGGFAVGSTSGYEIDGLLGGGYNLSRGRWTLTPQAALNYTAVRIDGFTERGSLVPLAIDSIDGDSLRTRLGGRLTCEASIGRARLRPEVGVFWQHELLDESHGVTAQLPSGLGGAFTVDDPEIGRDTMPISAGLNVQWTPRISTAFRYDHTLLGDDLNAYSFAAALNVSL